MGWMPQPKSKDWLNGYKNKIPIYAAYKRPTWGVAILISYKIDFKTKAVKRDKEGHYIMIKGSIQEDKTIINIYAPNIGALQYVRQNANKYERGN